MKKITVAAAILIGLIGLTSGDSVKALDRPLGNLKTCSFTCGTTAQQVTCGGVKSYSSIAIEVPGSTAVNFGGPEVTSSLGHPRSSSGKDTFSADASRVFCAAASNQSVTVTIGE